MIPHFDDFESLLDVYGELGSAFFLETKSQDDTSGTTRMIHVWSMNDETTMSDDPWPLDLDDRDDIEWSNHLLRLDG